MNGKGNPKPSTSKSVEPTDNSDDDANNENDDYEDSTIEDAKTRKHLRKLDKTMIVRRMCLYFHKLSKFFGVDDLLNYKEQGSLFFKLFILYYQITYLFVCNCWSWQMIQ